MDWSAIEPGAKPFHSVETFPEIWGIHHSEYCFLTAFQGNGNAESRQTRGEIGRPVQRINHPAPFSFVMLPAGFFGEGSVRGEMLMDKRKYGGFRLFVGNGDYIAVVQFG